MTVRRTRGDDRTPAEQRADEALAERAHLRELVDPRVRRAALAEARARGAARRAARARLRAMGPLEVPLVIERRGREFVAYAPGLPGAVGRGATKRSARVAVGRALRALVAADPAQVLEAVRARHREQETLLLELAD